MEPRNKAHAMLQRLEGLPGGLTIFSLLVCFRAPYFSSVKPRFSVLRPGYAEATARKRRKVTNHLGTVHAIAMANLCEFVAGTLMEISIAPHMRWIPKGMQIQYLDRAKTDVRAVCQIDHIDWDERQDVELQINVMDTNDVRVATAIVPMYVSPRKTKGATP